MSVAYFVSNISPKLVGFKLGNFELKKQYLEDKSRVSGCFGTLWPNTMDYFYKDDGGEYLLYFSSDEDLPLCKSKCLITTFRLFKSSKMSLGYPVYMNDQGGMCINAVSEYAYQSILDSDYDFHLTEYEKTEIVDFYNTIEPYFCREFNKGPIMKTIDYFHDSFRIENQEMKLVLRTAVIESFFPYRCGNKTQHFVNLIKDSVGNFDSEFKTKMDKVAREIYYCRGEFVHAGLSENIFDVNITLLDILRRIIAKMLIMDVIPEKVYEKRKEIGNFTKYNSIGGRIPDEIISKYPINGSWKYEGYKKSKE